MSWNPNAPNTIGQEWRAYLEGSLVLASKEQCTAFAIPSSAAESVAALAVPQVWAGASSGFGRLWADFYPLSDYAETDFTTVSYAPNEDKANDGSIARSDWSTTSNLYAQINDADDNESPWDDYIVNTDASTTHRARFQFNTSTFPAGKRPLSVTFEVRALGYSWSWQAPSIELSHWYAGNKKGTFGSFSVPRDDEWATYTVGPIYFDSNDEGPWNRQSILDFDDNTKDNLGVEFRYGCKITRITMKVTYVTDKRVAVASTAKQTTLPSGLQTGLPLTMAAVGTSVAGAWSKASGTSYLCVLRRIDSLSGNQFSPGVYYLDSGVAPPQDSGTHYSAAALTDAGGTVSSLGSATTRLVPFALSVGGAQSIDSQPYYDVEAKPVSQAVHVSQGIGNGDGASSYKRLRAMIGVTSTSTLPTQPLVFGVRKTAATVTETFTGANGSAPGATWTAGSFSAGAASSIQSNALQMTTGTTANAYARYRSTSAQGSNLLMTGKVTFASIASAHYAMVYVRGSSTFATGVPALQSSYDIAFRANGAVQLYRADAAGAETMLWSTSFAFVAGTQYSFRIVTLSNGFIGVKVWATASAEPEPWTYTWVDTTHTGSYVALGAQNDTSGGTSRTVTWDDISISPYLTVGDLTAADLSDANISTSKGVTSYAPGSLTVYDTTVTMDASAVLAAVDHTVDVASYQVTGSAWHLLWLDSSAYGLTGNQTFGGSTDTAILGGVGTATADFMLTLGSVPTAPAGFTVTTATAALPDAGDISCSVPSMTYVSLSWTATALGSSFTQYEVQRSEDGGSTWVPVADVITESVHTWQDYQAPRGVAVQYRVRVVRSDGATSDWSTQAGTVTCPASGNAILITSNEDPTLNSGFVILGDDYTYNFPSADDLVLVKPYNEDYHRAFRPMERRGVVWPFRVLIYSRGVGMPSEQGSPPNGEGVRAFDTLRDIAETQAEVALLTPDGERIFCALKVPSGTRKAKAHYYAAAVTAIQTGSAPTKVVIS